MGKQISLIKVGERILLTIGDEQIEVSDYKILSSAGNVTELSVTFSFDTNEFEMSASLKG